MNQIEKLIDLMHNQLVKRKASTYQIDALYRIVKENFSDCILCEVDNAILKKIAKEDSDANAQNYH